MTTRSKVPSGSQVSFGTEYQSQRVANRVSSSRTDTVVLTGTGTGSAPGASTGTGTPLKGVGTSQKAPTQIGTTQRTEHASPDLKDADVKELPAFLLPACPLPVTLCCLHSVFVRGLYVCFEQDVRQALRARNEVVFDALEWSALVSASSKGRASAASLAEWCESKVKQKTWRLKLHDALGGALGADVECDALTVGAVLDGWECTLTRVQYGKDQPS